VILDLEFSANNELQDNIMIDCISCHFRDGHAKIYKLEELGDFINDLNLELDFLFAVINLRNNKMPLIIKNRQELLGLLIDLRF